MMSLLTGELQRLDKLHLYDRFGSCESTLYKWIPLHIITVISGSPKECLYIVKTCIEQKLHQIWLNQDELKTTAMLSGTICQAQIQFVEAYRPQDA